MAYELPSTLLSVVQVAAALLTPVVAGVGIWIAIQQTNIQRNKLKLDRFDRRFTIYEAAMTFVSTIASSDKVDDNIYREFIAKTRGARFMVSQDIDEYLREILKKVNALRAVKSMMSETPASPEEREKAAQRWLDLQHGLENSSR